MVGIKILFFFKNWVNQIQCGYLGVFDWFEPGMSVHLYWEGVIVYTYLATWNDGLCSDPVAPVVEDHGPEGEQTLQVHGVVHLT